MCVDVMMRCIYPSAHPPTYHHSYVSSTCQAQTRGLSYWSCRWVISEGVEMYRNGVVEPLRATLPASTCPLSTFRPSYLPTFRPSYLPTYLPNCPLISPSHRDPHLHAQMHQERHPPIQPYPTIIIPPFPSPHLSFPTRLRTDVDDDAEPAQLMIRSSVGTVMSLLSSSSSSPRACFR